MLSNITMYMGQMAAIVAQGVTPLMWSFLVIAVVSAVFAGLRWQ